jgi:collagen type XVIII alpha
MGPPGQPGQPGASYPSSAASSQQSGSGGGGIVSVFPTSTELFASHRSIQEGQLAFSTSSQELYIRVRNGFKIVKLEGFMPTLDQRPPVTAPVDEYRPPPSVTQSYEPEIRTLAPPRRIEPPPREDIDYQLRLRHQQQREQQLRDQQLREQQIREQQQRDQQYPQHQRHYSRANPQDKVLHLIALNAPVNGKMGGIRGADLQCYQHARQSGYRTTFRAFLSSNVQDLRDLVHYADNDTIVVNSRGEKLFDTWSHIFNPTTSPYNAPIYSFNQKNIFDEKQQWQDRYIWHGSDESGRRLEQNFCEFWRTNDQYAHGMASAVERGRPLITDAEPISCHRHLIVLCVENMSKYNVDVRLGQRKRRKY